MKIRSIILISLLAFLFSCKPVVDDFEPSQGAADFSSFVAVGNSLSAGYADGALYTSGQLNAFPSIIAQQMTYAGGGSEFKVPIIPSEVGVRPTLTPQGLYYLTKLVVGYSTDCLGNTSLAPVPAVENPDQQELAAALHTPIAADGPFNNVAVPGIRITHLFAPGLGQLNPYYGRFATDPTTDRLIDEPAKVDPTFFLFWVGNNDILGYATSGGLDPITPAEGPVGVGFKSSYETAIMAMLSLTDKGVVANIADVTAIPFLNTIPYNPIVLTEQAQVDALNGAYAQYNQLMASVGLPYRINFALGQNPMVIFDVDMPLPPAYEQFKFRQITENEKALLSLPQDSLKCAGWGTQKPVPNQYVLTELELSNIDDATADFNAFIKTTVDGADLAFLDAFSIIRNLDNGGLVFDGVEFSSRFILGNAYSTDGIHMTPQGNAMAANYFIDAINLKYSANIPTVNITDYPPILLP